MSNLMMFWTGTHSSEERYAEEDPAVHADPKASIMGKEDIGDADLDECFDRSIEEPDQHSIGVPLGS